RHAARRRVRSLDAARWAIAHGDRHQRADRRRARAQRSTLNRFGANAMTQPAWKAAASRGHERAQNCEIGAGNAGMTVAVLRSTLRPTISIAFALALVSCTRSNLQLLDGAVAGGDDLATTSDAVDMAVGGSDDLARPPDLDNARPLPALPLHTSGRWIVDA